MSLTSNLSKRNNPIREWFESKLPNLETFQKDVRTCGDLLLPSPTQVSLNTVGTAFDYRIRYWFDISPTDSLVAAIIGKIIYEADELDLSQLWKLFVLSLEKTLQNTSPVGRELNKTEEILLLRYCWVLALFEEILRGGFGINSPLFTVASTDPNELLSLASDLAIQDLLSLMKIAYKSQLLVKPIDKPILNPTFSGSMFVGGADADLILDGCLIDLKTTKSKTPTRAFLSRKDYYQLIGYVILDFKNEYNISSLSFYLARRGASVTWTVNDFIDQASSGKWSIKKLRKDFLTNFTFFNRIYQDLDE